MLLYKVIEPPPAPKKERKKRKTEKMGCEHKKHHCPETQTVNPFYILVKRTLQGEELRESQSIDLQFNKKSN